LGNVTQLGYLGIGVSDIGRWEGFATEVLGLQTNGTDPDGTLFLRMDDNHHRFALHPGGKDDLAYAGWETSDEASLRAMASRLESMGVEVRWATAAEARERRVLGLIKLADPSGVATEIYYGPLIEFERPFHSPRAIAGFETGNMGLGHFVLAVDDYEESLRFYRDGLGLRLSDFIEFEAGPDEYGLVAFLHCNPRHHSVAFFQYEWPKRLLHFMLQLRRIDDLGTTYDLCQDGKVPIARSLGRHTNDHMVSFYLESPSGFEIEYGFGAREIDDRVWEVQLHRANSTWGHRIQTATPIMP
jgi:biphenyl-2,3-diol 1,2-dioxygenase